MVPSPHLHQIVGGNAFAPTMDPALNISAEVHMARLAALQRGFLELLDSYLVLPPPEWLRAPSPIDGESRTRKANEGA